MDGHVSEPVLTTHLRQKIGLELVAREKQRLFAYHVMFGDINYGPSISMNFLSVSGRIENMTGTEIEIFFAENDILLICADVVKGPPCP